MNKRKIHDLPGELRLSESELNTRVKEILEVEPENLYRDCIVKNDGDYTSRHGYTTQDTHRLFWEIITEAVIEHGKVLHGKVDKKCTYNNFEKRKNIVNKINSLINEKKVSEVYKEYYTSEKSSKISETKLLHCLYHALQSEINGFCAVDYQIPTTNGSKDNIDLFLKKGNTFYMIEAKTFGSKESLLRCVLEIETYYEKLNERLFKIYNFEPSQLKKAILVPQESAAWKQKDMDWAKKILNHFEIKIFELCNDENALYVKELDN